MAKKTARRNTSPPECGWTFADHTCTETDAHVCEPRVQHVVGFFSDCLVHTKGRWARQRFVPRPWQVDEILRPLFGTVYYDEELGRFVRRYRLAYISCARKNGKSELLAGIALYLLCADNEFGAEVYGAACDRDQARKVFDVALKMVQLSPAMSSRLIAKEHAKRLVDERTGSYYEIVAADASGNLGHNPSGVVFDELLTQRDSKLWDALRTAAGARDQPLLAVATTATDDPSSFAGLEHLECQKIAADPERAPHRFVWIKETPADADPFDESVWHLANPALGDFLSWETLRQEAKDAQNDPTKEHVWRQFRLNQLRQSASHWMPMNLWDATAGEPWPRPDWRARSLVRRQAFAGLDLAAKLDLTAWCLVFPDDVANMTWRFWLPEDGLPDLDMATGGMASVWAADGWITVTEGNVVDYDRIYADIEADGNAYAIREVGYDRWSGEPAIQELSKRLGRSVSFVDIPQTYTGLSPGMNELMALVKSGQIAHHANPVARFCFESVEVRHPNDDPDLIRPVKPKRGQNSKRIDAVVTAAMAVGSWRTRVQPKQRTGRVTAF